MHLNAINNAVKLENVYNTNTRFLQMHQKSINDTVKNRKKLVHMCCEVLDKVMSVAKQNGFDGVPTCEDKVEWMISSRNALYKCGVKQYIED